MMTMMTPGSHCMPGIVLSVLDVLIINFSQQHDVLGSIWSHFIDADLYYILHPGICTALRIWQITKPTHVRSWIYSPKTAD